jgi:alkyl sulfatase BDS1-like metallo-beta-lactamase superfamily hydrolase
MGKALPAADISVETTRAVLEAIAQRPRSVGEAIASGACRVTGDAAGFEALFAMLDEFALMFNIVAPDGRSS